MGSKTHVFAEDERYIIGLGSQAQIGKDYAVSLMIKHYGSQNVYRAAFADELKADLFEVLKERADINVFMPTDGEKKLIRPVLVAYGEMMRHLREDYWVDRAFARISRRPEPVIVITDCRYPNEVEVLQKRGGVYFDIETDRPPANASEAKNSPLCRAMANKVIRNNFDEKFGADLISAFESL